MKTQPSCINNTHNNVKRVLTLCDAGIVDSVCDEMLTQHSFTIT